jgi:hypothetical protein
VGLNRSDQKKIKFVNLLNPGDRRRSYCRIRNSDPRNSRPNERSLTSCVCGEVVFLFRRHHRDGARTRQLSINAYIRKRLMPPQCLAAPAFTSPHPLLQFAIPREFSTKLSNYIVFPQTRVNSYAAKQRSDAFRSALTKNGGRTALLSSPPRISTRSARAFEARPPSCLWTGLRWKKMSK